MVKSGRADTFCRRWSERARAALCGLRPCPVARHWTRSCCADRGQRMLRRILARETCARKMGCVRCGLGQGCLIATRFCRRRRQQRTKHHADLKYGQRRAWVSVVGWERAQDVGSARCTRWSRGDGLRRRADRAQRVGVRTWWRVVAHGMLTGFAGASANANAHSGNGQR